MGNEYCCEDRTKAGDFQRTSINAENLATKGKGSNLTVKKDNEL